MHKLLRMAAIVDSTVAALMLVPTSASAATCCASCCTFKDPQATGCAADAITAKSAVRSGRTIELRYSPTCRAALGTPPQRPNRRLLPSMEQRRTVIPGPDQRRHQCLHQNGQRRGQIAWVCTEYIGPAPDTCTGVY